jgi:hypothetical protein
MTIEDFLFIEPASELPATVPVSPEPRSESPMSVELPPTLPVSPDIQRTTFRDVFLAEIDLFWNLSLALAVMCLHEHDDVLASFAVVVCRHSLERRNDVKRAMEMAMRSVLRLSNPVILSVANSLTSQEWIHLYGRFHRLYPAGVLSNSIALRDAMAVERFIPLGFDDAYIDSYLGQDEISPNHARTWTLRTMIDYCLTGRGWLNNLVVYGIFASVANREDAISFIDHSMENNTTRSKNLKRLLRESYWISDISDIHPTSVDASLPRVQGLQLTYNPRDLVRLNADRPPGRQLSVTYNTL